MKYSIVCLFVLFLFLQVKAQGELDIYFTVQLAAVKNPIPKTNKLFSDMPNLEEVKFEDGFYRYFSGNFMAHHFAQDYLKKVHAMGYEDAFILAIKDGKERLTAEEAIELIYGE
ncbi:MAG: hypothetical protein WD048_01495 [Chitinophagales bacterium]